MGRRTTAEHTRALRCTRAEATAAGARLGGEAWLRSTPVPACDDPPVPVVGTVYRLYPPGRTCPGGGRGRG